MKVLKVVKQEKKTKEGKAFTKASDINPNKIEFPLTLKGLKGFKTDDIEENKEFQELVNKLIKYIHERY